MSEGGIRCGSLTTRFSAACSCVLWRLDCLLASHDERPSGVSLSIPRFYSKPRPPNIHWPADADEYPNTSVWEYLMTARRSICRFEPGISVPGAFFRRIALSQSHRRSRNSWCCRYDHASCSSISGSDPSIPCSMRQKDTYGSERDDDRLSSRHVIEGDPGEKGRSLLSTPERPHCTPEL